MIQRTEGFILKTYDFRETSKIAYFYTKEFGKIKGILKGIKQNRKNFSTTLEPGSKNEIIFYPNRKNDLNLVSKCDLLEDFPFLRKDIKRMFISNCFLELIDNITALEEKDKPIFELLNFSLNALDNGFDPEILWIFFQIKTLKLTGFKPQLKTCLLCQKGIDSLAYFSLRFGGLLCCGCRKKDIDSKKLLKGALSSLLYIEEINPERLHSFRIDRKIRYELQALLKRFIQYHLEKEIKSERFLNQILY